MTVNITDNDFASLVAPYSNDFQAITGVAGLGEGWSVFSVDSDTGRTWNAGTASGDRFAQANAFNGTAPADDWLISPPFDLDATANEAVSFETWTQYADSGITEPALKFLYSTNYTGVGSPAAATWTELTYAFPDANSQVFTPSGNVDVSGITGTQVWFAFQYQSSGTGGGTSTSWRVDDFSIALVTADVTPPTVVTLSPSDDATDVPVNANLVVTFDEPIAKGTGNIQIRRVDNNDIVQTIAVTDAAVTVAGAVATIDPPADLLSSTALYVTIDAGAFTDTAAALNPFAGITAATTWNFTTAEVDSTPPELTAAVGATVDAPFAVTFTDDATWRAAITEISVGGTALPQAAYAVDTAGEITFTPFLSTLLQTPGNKSILVLATGYTAASVSQSIDVGVATQLSVLTQPVGPVANGGSLATQPVIRLLDQFNNLSNSTADVTASVGAGTWTLGGTTTVAAVAGTVTFAGLTATSTVAVTGATIEFNSAGLTAATSSAFDIVAPVSDLDAPTTLPATNVTQTSFTANWSSVIGATSYVVDVFQSTTVNMTDLIISEYVEGNSNNKYVEIFNGTGATVNLSDFQLRAFNNGASIATSTQALNTLTGGPTELANGETLVLRNGSAALTLPSGVTAFSSGAVNFNGDDALGLFKISTDSFVDIFGVIGDRPDTAWTGDGGYTTIDKTLRRKSDVLGGVTTNPTGTGPTAFTTLTTEWDLFDVNTATGLGAHTFDGVEMVFVPGFQGVSVAGTSLEVTGLSPNTEYFYVVRAVDAVGESADSDIRSVTTENVIVVTPTITASPLTKVYDGSAFTVTATADDGVGGFDADVNQGNFTFTFYAAAGATGGVVAAPTNAGTYSVEVAYAGNSNYNPVASTVFDFTITPATLTATATADGKVYDANTDASVTISLIGVIGGDTVSGSASGTFNDKNVGDDKPVTVGTVTLSGADAGNYTFDTVTNSPVANINPATLTASATAEDKVYDATTGATVTISLTGVLAADVVSGAASGTFGDKNVGTAKEVTLGAVSLSGADSGNYVVTAAPANPTADITPATLTASVTVLDRVFVEGSTDATIDTRTIDGVFAGDDVQLIVGVANFDTPDIGTDKPVTVVDLTLSGADAGNYVFNSTATTTATIMEGPSEVAPQVTSVQINAADTYLNNNQRSQLTSVVVNFDQTVTLADGAFQIENANTRVAIATGQLLITPNDSNDSFTIRFGEGAGVVTREFGNGSSLEDGNYRLIIDSSKVSSGGTTMQENFHFGDTAVDNFFRLFGDSDGDGDVDARDMGALRRAIRGLEYNAALDANGNGVIVGDTADLDAFAVNRNQFRPAL